MKQAPDLQARFTGVLFAIAACLLIWELVHIATWLRVLSPDAALFFLVWWNKLLQLGYFHALTASYSDLTPPTLYLFTFMALFRNAARPWVLLKLINLPFLPIAASLAYGIARRLDANKARSAAVALLVLLLPVVWQDAFHWGQFDMFYTTFLLGTAYALLAGRSTLAMVLFGSALAIKLPAIFLAPALAAMLFAGELSAPAVALVPLMYVVWVLPAAIAGRSWHSLLGIYLRQSQSYPKLSLDAPNLYLLFQDLIPAGRPFQLASLAAVSLAALAAAWMIGTYLRARKAGTPSPDRMIAVMTFSLLAMPYLLPRMHERYYLPGDIFAVLLLATKPRLLLPIILLQTATLATFHRYFVDAALNLSRSLWVFPVVVMFVAMACMTWFFREEMRNTPVRRT